MARLWKSMWRSLVKSLWEKCGYILYIWNFDLKVWNSFRFPRDLHLFYMVFCAGFLKDFSLLSLRFYTISTEPITTTINI